jgi:hypothetical protein
LADDRKQPQTRGNGNVDISLEIGYDVRELIMEGYSWAQINRVRDGKITMRQLFKEKPENKA